VIVDCHMHVKGGDLYRREYGADFIVRRLDEAGIDRAVVFSICLGSRESNDLTYREAQKFPDRLIGFAHVNPEEGDLAVEELGRAVKGLNFKFQREEERVHALRDRKEMRIVISYKYAF